jgi:hypothetical protein
VVVITIVGGSGGDAVVVSAMLTILCAERT